MAFINNISFILISLIKLISLVSSIPLGNGVRVPFCPVDKGSWMAASKRLNCEQYNRDYMYHCTINPYLNATFETCNIEREIVGYKCTEYNQRGQIIQESVLKCQYHEQACPERYYSTEAYKYQGCYIEVYRKMKICPEETSFSSDIPSDISSIVSTTLENCISEEKENSMCVQTILCIAFFIIFGLENICLCVWIFRRRFACKDISKASIECKDVSLKIFSVVEKENKSDKITHTLIKEQQPLVDEPDSTVSSNYMKQNFVIPEKLAVIARNLESDIDVINLTLKENDYNEDILKKYVFMMKEKLQMLQGENGLFYDSNKKLGEIVSSSRSV
ncbi:uncharacterized protein LOC134254964 [Saccostrea cucullata]|uniref:uncharacterized protein LOC134254964 n=1 Tax=Saccostrea cuccullata TaxID=36930 RepID=UPI002ED4E221